MQVILFDKILKLGNVGSKVIVKSGYAINFLIPRGISIYNNKNFFLKNKVNFKKNDIIIKENKIFINFYVKCNSNGYLFGSINNKKIILITNNYNIKIKKKFFLKSIRKIGNYIIKIKINNNDYKIILFKIFNKI